jgi:hypothetical protein
MWLLPFLRIPAIFFHFVLRSHSSTFRHFTILFFLASRWSDWNSRRPIAKLRIRTRPSRLQLVGGKRTAGPALIVLISQDVTAFLFPPVERLCWGDIPVMAAMNQYKQGIKNTEVSLYGGYKEDIQVRLSNQFRSSLNDLVADRIPYQFAYRVDFQLAHDVGSVRFRGLDADAEGGSNFLAAFSFREQLHDFALS